VIKRDIGRMSVLDNINKFKQITIILEKKIYVFIVKNLDIGPNAVPGFKT